MKIARILLTVFTFVFTTSRVVRAFQNSEQTSDESAESKHLKICALSGGLDIARFQSSLLQNIFSNALLDVELIREYISEAAYNQGIAGGLHELDQMMNSIDWAARNLSSSSTTISAGLGYVDDRRSRRVERYVGTVNQPMAGTKELDMAMIDSASNIYPWLIDRRSDESSWWFDHQNGKQVSGFAARNNNQRLYTAAWIGTSGEAWLYYPPLTKTVDFHPFSAGDFLGPAYDSSEEPFIKPNLPPNNPERVSYFTKPYSDTAVPGLSLVTAQAPIYFSGNFRGTLYDDAYIASAGLDISMASISTYLDELERTLTHNSFAFVVDSDTFDVVIISQYSVQQIYPPRTGFEDSRVFYGGNGDGEVVSDRRNQTYLPSDTLFQSPLKLNNANWKDLADEVQTAAPGRRSWLEMPITLTGDQQPTNFYAMYEKWENVANWTLVVFAAVDEVNNAVKVAPVDPRVVFEAESGETTTASVVLVNDGTLDVIVEVSQIPPWMRLVTDIASAQTLPAGSQLHIDFAVAMNDTMLKTNSISSFIAFTITDDDYPDCFHRSVVSIPVDLRIIELDYLKGIRPYGLILAGVIMLTSVIFSYWVLQNRELRVVQASQPLFLNVMCCGIFLMGVSIIPMGVDDTIASVNGCSMACMSIPWFLATGFSVTFSALFSKIWRINQIVESCLKLRRATVSAKDVIIPFAIIFSLNTFLLTLWSIIAPVVWLRKTLDDGQSVGYCALDGTASRAFASLVVLLNFFALVIALIQLYKARALSMEYSEGQSIIVAVGSMVQVFLTGIPILFIVQKNPRATYFVKSTIVFVMSMSLLLLTFLPKIFLVSRTKQNPNADRSTSSSNPRNLSGPHDEGPTDKPPTQRIDDEVKMDQQHSQQQLDHYGSNHLKTEVRASYPSILNRRERTHRANLNLGQKAAPSPADNPEHLAAKSVFALHAKPEQHDGLPRVPQRRFNPLSSQSRDSTPRAPLRLPTDIEDPGLV